MKRSAALFLQGVVVLLGIGAFVWMLWEPQLEGRNAGATVLQVYFNDPFLAYVYVGAIAFFAGLHSAFRLLGYVRRGETVSGGAVMALRRIRYCAFILIGFILGAEGFLFTVQRGKDDIAGGAMMGLLLMVVSAGVAAAASVLERHLQARAGDAPA